LLPPELAILTTELNDLASEQDIALAGGEKRIDDVLTYALFPQAGLRFLKNRGEPGAFEVAPGSDEKVEQDSTKADKEIYTVVLEGISYTVSVSEGGDIDGIVPISDMDMWADTRDDDPGASDTDAAHVNTTGSPISAPLTVPIGGNIIKVLVTPGQRVEEGEEVVILEAMKMETPVCSLQAGVIENILVKEGDSVSVGDCLLTIAVA